MDGARHGIIDVKELKLKANHNRFSLIIIHLLDVKELKLKANHN